MAASNSSSMSTAIVDVEDWLEEDRLVLIEGWSRDGYTLQDIAQCIGITAATLGRWRKEHEEINNALRKGKEVMDYLVENALIKSALGYTTSEVKVTTRMVKGCVVETITEQLTKEQAPNVSAIQCYLYNRLPKKWKKNRDNIFETDEEDMSLQITVTRAGVDNADQEDPEWVESVNKQITVTPTTEEQREDLRRQKESDDRNKDELLTKVEIEESGGEFELSAEELKAWEAWDENN